MKVKSTIHNIMAAAIHLQLKELFLIAAHKINSVIDRTSIEYSFVFL